MNISRRSLLLSTTGFAVAAAVLPSAFGLSAARAETPSNMIRFVPQADIQVLDPVVTNNYNTRNFAYMIWDTLFAMDEQFRPQPQMVDAWSVSEDTLTYQFTLREGLVWHDGEPVRAADCVASLKRWAAKSPVGQKMMAVTEGIETIDEQSFRIVLQEPFGQVLEALASLSGYVPFMMPERLAKTDPNTAITEIVGSGPFVFLPEQWDAGNKLVFRRFEGYVPRSEPASLAAGGKVVGVETVEWTSIPDPSTAANALMTGEVDWWELPLFDLLPLLRTNPDVNVANIDKLGSQALLRFNQVQPPFDDLLARQAVAVALNQVDYMQAVAGEQSNWRTCYSVYACGLPLSTEAGTEILSSPRNLERAQELLKQSGYNGEKVVVISVAEIPVMQAMALVTVDLLSKIGFNAELQPSDQGAYFQRRNNRGPVDEGGWSVFCTWIVAPDTANPAVSTVLRANGFDGYAGWPDVPEIEELRADWIKTSDPEKQVALATKIQELTLANLNYIPLGQFYLPTAMRASLQGVVDSPIPFFWNIKKS